MHQCWNSSAKSPSSHWTCFLYSFCLAYLLFSASFMTTVICYSFHLLTLDSLFLSCSLYYFSLLCTAQLRHGFFPRTSKMKLIELTKPVNAHIMPHILWPMGKVWLQDSFLKVCCGHIFFLWHKGEHKTILWFINDNKSGGFFLFCFFPNGFHSYSSYSILLTWIRLFQIHEIWVRLYRSVWTESVFIAI